MSATLDRSPEAAVDALWRQLRHRFTLARSVLSPVFVFGGADRVLTDLRDRVRNVAQLECWPFLECAPAEAADSMIMRLLLGGEPIAWRMIWIDLRVAASGHRAIVLSLMARLNERRGELERRPAIVVFLLPQGWEPEVAAAAPDLWHVRQASVAVPFGTASPPASQAIESGADAPPPPDPVRLAPAVERYRWRRRHAGAPVSLWDGLFAVDEALAAGLDEEAKEIAADTLALAETRVRSRPDDRGALRDLSVSFDKVGDAASARGDTAAAQAAYARSLEMMERLIAMHGENREALGDLATVHLLVAALVGRGDADVDGASHRQQARALLTRLSMAFPDIARYREQLAWLDQQETTAHD